MPLCYQILVEIVSEELKNSSIPTDLLEVRAFFTDLFRSADTQESGVLFYQDIMELMRQADLGLSTVQIHMIMSEAMQDEDGYINYTEFADSAAGIYVNMMDFDRHAEFKAKVTEMRADDGHMAVGDGFDQATVEARLQECFAEEDMEATGTLPRATVTAAIGKAVPGLTQKQTNLLLSYAHIDPSTNRVSSGAARGGERTIDLHGAQCAQRELMHGVRMYMVVWWCGGM